MKLVKMGLAAALLATGSMALSGSDHTGRGLFGNGSGHGDKKCDVPGKCDTKHGQSRGICNKHKPEPPKCVDDVIDAHKTFRPLVNHNIKGRILDFTFNHGKDYRIYSQALGQKRDLYVYLPPGFDRNTAYPVMFYLHGIFMDEKSFLNDVVVHLDRAICAGKLPPMIAVAPDGSFEGNPCRLEPGSFFINGPRGDYQDWIVKDVFKFVAKNFHIRPEPKLHIIAGASMGGFGAYNTAIKYPWLFGTVIGVMPALNIRWVDQKGCYQTNFDPYNWGWRNRHDDPNEVLAKVSHIKIRMCDFIYPVFGTDFNAIMLASQENPIELIDHYRLRNGDLDMFVGYAGRDEFNLDAQAESFIYLARSRGIAVGVHKVPGGTHSEMTAQGMIPNVIEWLGERMEINQTMIPAAPGGLIIEDPTKPKEGDKPSGGMAKPISDPDIPPLPPISTPPTVPTKLPD
jgi:S-formylglutathione hydrolase FrmB